MYGVAWILVTGAIVVVGLVIALALTAWVPLLAFLILVIAIVGLAAYLPGRRIQIGTERERAARGEAAAGRARSDAAPASGEGSSPGADDREGYEPAV